MSNGTPAAALEVGRKAIVGKETRKPASAIKKPASAVTGESAKLPLCTVVSCCDLDIADGDGALRQMLLALLRGETTCGSHFKTLLPPQVIDMSATRKANQKGSSSGIQMRSQQESSPLVSTFRSSKQTVQPPKSLSLEKQVEMRADFLRLRRRNPAAARSHMRSMREKHAHQGSSVLQMKERSSPPLDRKKRMEHDAREEQRTDPNRRPVPEVRRGASVVQRVEVAEGVSTDIEELPRRLPPLQPPGGIHAKENRGRQPPALTEDEEVALNEQKKEELTHYCFWKKKTV